MTIAFLWKTTPPDTLHGVSDMLHLRPKSLFMRAIAQPPRLPWIVASATGSVQSARPARSGLQAAACAYSTG